MVELVLEHVTSSLERKREPEGNNQSHISKVCPGELALANQPRDASPMASIIPEPLILLIRQLFFAILAQLV
jgi:hypothetical protein